MFIHVLSFLTPLSWLKLISTLSLQIVNMVLRWVCTFFSHVFRNNKGFPCLRPLRPFLRTILGSHPVFVNNLTVSCNLWSGTIMEHCYLLKRKICFIVKCCNVIELTCDEKIRIYEQFRCIMFHSKVSISKWYTRTAIVDRHNCYTLAVSLIDNQW